MAFRGFSSQQEQTERLARRSHRLIVMFIVIVGFATLLAAFQIFGRIDDLLARNEAAANDNRTWNFAQLEVDIVKFNSALAEARLLDASPESLEVVRRHYDILFSRVALLSSNISYENAPIRQTPEWLVLTDPAGLFQSWVSLIDGPDDRLAAALPEMMQVTGPLRSGLRRSVVDTVFESIGEGDILRKSLRDTLRLFAGAAFFLLSGMALLLLGLYMQSVARTRHARLMEIALENLRQTINTAPDAVLIVNRSGHVVATNMASSDLFGSRLDLERPPLGEVLIGPTDNDAPLDPLKLIAGQRLRVQGLRSDGSRFPAEVSVGLGRTDTGRPVTVLFLRDISEQLAHEQTLAEARNAAQAADDAKARFLRVMSHEMRTPLNGLLSAADLMTRTTRLDDTQRWLADIIRTCGQSALEQVNNVLHLSRMGSTEAGDYPVSPVSLQRYLRDIVHQFTADAARNGTSLDMVGFDGPPLGVALPVQLLRRALGNLISNAVKFTQSGSITVSLSHELSADGLTADLRIAVRDTGIGIAQDDLDRIFRNFETLDSSYSRMRDGSGLGLGIAKLAVEEMAGRIETESELGKGSCFTLVLRVPVALVAAPPEAEQKVEGQPLMGLCLLLADDNVINRALMARQLEGLGADVTTVSDGHEAVEAAVAKAYDLILMDISMPRLDGLTATQLIRTQGASRAVPIVAVTANAMPDRIAHYKGAGMADVLVKPASVSALVSTILRLVLRPALPKPQPMAQVLVAEPKRSDQFEDLRSALGDAFLIDMTSKFREETDTAMVAARAAIAKRDFVALRAVAHKTAGAAAALGLSDLNLLLVQQEDAIFNEDEDDAIALQDQIEQVYALELARLQSALTPGKTPKLKPDLRLTG